VVAVRLPFRGGRNSKQWPKQQGKKRSQPSSNRRLTAAEGDTAQSDLCLAGKLGQPAC